MPQAPVVQKLDSAIHRINPYPMDISVSETNCAIQCIEVYPVDSVINLLNNWGQEKVSSETYKTNQLCDRQMIQMTS